MKFLWMLLLFRTISASAQDSYLSFYTHQGEKLEVSDTHNSGCVSETRSNSPANQWGTIVLTKEGSTLTVELLNYRSNCGTTDFDVHTDVAAEGDGAPCSLLVSVTPVVPMPMDCNCPFNVSFTIRDVTFNSFYLKCWWYGGQVELTDGEPLVLEDIRENVTIDGLGYTLRKTLRQAMLMDLNGLEGELRIPSELTYEGITYSVTDILSGLFYRKSAVTKVILPSTFRSLSFGERDYYENITFYNWSALESVEVEEGNPFLSVVDGVLFNKEKTMLLSLPPNAHRTTYTVPAGVTHVAGGAFACSQYLEKITLTDEVTTIGGYAFGGSTRLEEVRMPSRLQELSPRLFMNCPQLKLVNMPEGVTSFGHQLFEGCSSLTAVTMPETVKTVDSEAFMDCVSLKSVVLSPMLQAITYGMFTGCSSLTDIVIPEGVTSISNRAFSECFALQTVDLPESVSSLGGWIFQGCKLQNLYVRGVLDDISLSRLFACIGTEVSIFVQPSEVERYRSSYSGAVYPLSDVKETTGIAATNFLRPDDSKRTEVEHTNHANENGAWCLPDGRQLSAKPTKKGIYIHGGCKVVIK